MGLGCFAISCCRRIYPLLKAPKAGRFDSIGKRIVGVFEFAFGQKRILFRDLKSGIFHAFIFWGFCVISIRTIILFARGYDPDFDLPGFDGAIGTIYLHTKDIFVVLVMIGCIALLFRRLVLRPPRLTFSLEGNLILIAIMILMITELMIDRTTGVLERSAYYTHIIGILLFLNYLPYGKHFHILTSIPNVFFRNLQPAGAIRKIELEDEDVTTFGIDNIKQFDRKALLDMYSCTECGRCQDECPAYACEKPLSPKEFTIALRDHFYSRGKESDRQLIGDIIQKETIWACTTCRACEEACPLMIEYVQRIIDLRRNMALMHGDIPPEAETALKNIETNSNPWGFGFSDRGAWAKDLGIKILSQDRDVEFLFFVGCAGSFDEKGKRTSVAIAKLLQKAGVSFGILGDEEICTGDSARRLGNEYLFQNLARKNIEIFNRYGVGKILTACPHCYNTIKNEFPQFGGNFEVYHHSEILLKLIEDGKLVPKKNNGAKTTYHDSCYLGRYNNIYDEPRNILEACGVKIREMARARDTAHCCGAGGGWMWMEDKSGKRINQMRLKDAMETNAKVIASACPYCHTMLHDASKDMNVEDKYEVKDIAEILVASV